MITRVPIRINPPDLLVELHILEDAIPALRTAIEVTTASLVQCHPVAFAPKCLIHDIAAKKSKVVIVADSTYAGDWLSIQLTDEKATRISRNECLRIMYAWIPPGGFHPRDRNILDVCHSHFPDDVAAACDIFGGL